jgi:hypothetical protein
MSVRSTPATWPRIGAYEADAWTGLVFAPGPGRGAALRLSAEIDGRRIEPRDFLALTHEIGPCASDESYAAVSFDLAPVVEEGATIESIAARPPRPIAKGEPTIEWEWARLDPDTLVARATVRHVPSARSDGRPTLRLWIEGVNPWDWSARWRATPGELSARIGPANASDTGDASSDAPVDLIVNAVEPRAADVAEDGEDGRSARLAFDLDSGASVAFVARLGRVPARTEAGAAALGTTTLGTTTLDRARAAYLASCVDVEGDWQGLAASLTNNLHWMTLLQPETGRRYLPAGRRWIFPRPDQSGRDDWTIFEWDGFFNALLVSLEAPDLAREMIESLVATQHENGLMPNWRSRRAGTTDRSQPPIGAFIVLKLVLRAGDDALARLALPALDRWHAWWSSRPGHAVAFRRRRPSGLFAWGSDVDALPGWVPPWEVEASHRQKAAWESGQDDLPNWDDVPWDERTSTLAMDCVDLSALLALDAECLALLHDRVGDPAHAAAYRSERARNGALVNERLWDESRGLYADRFDDGRFSARVAASNFYPLLAGIVPTDRERRLLETLLDPARFWGDWIVPTISRDDPAFPDQQYWRGTIWPPTNYLVYEALRRVRADEAAATLAARSVALFVGDWRTHQLCRENFSGIDGAGGGQRHQSWGPLFSWIGLAEFGDVSPWDGLRIGAADVEHSSTVRRLRLAGSLWDISLSPTETVVTRDGRELLRADGPVCLREVEVHSDGLTALVSARRETRLVARDGEVMTVPAREVRVSCRGGSP